DNMTIVKGFSSCSALTTVILPPSITTIADEAFQFCSKLSSVNIPEGVTYIGTYAFYRCIFQQISIPESVTYLGANAFNGTSLTSVVIPNSITDIKNAFSSCAKLKSITLPTGIKEIAAGAFSSCSALTEIVLPPSVTTIGANAFYNCKALKNVYMGPNIKSMDQNAFYLVTLSNLYITAQTPPSVYSQFNTDVHLHVQGEETLKEYTKETIPDPSGGTLYNQWRYYTNISTMIVPTEIKISKEEASSAPMRIIDNPYSSADHIYGQPGDTFIRMATLIPEDSPMQQTFWSSSDPSKVAVNNAGAISIKEYPEINNPVTLSVETLYSDGPTAKVTIENYLMTDVNSIPSDSENVGSDTSAQTQIFTIGGLPVGNSLNGLTSGIYIVKQGNKVVKLNIR
ncbi:MAG: leucine-rich repeat domain-containing protein, partial [Muribaculaceae bacterium]|nr:leucine-rich repeat domain-containing protein [Muribaculaceae bacterium]